MVNKNLMSQALQVFNHTTTPNLVAKLSEEISDIQELSEEVMSQVWGGAVPPDPYIVRPVPPDPYIVRFVPPDPYIVHPVTPAVYHNPPMF
jgi:hypothetical protein